MLSVGAAIIGPENTTRWNSRLYNGSGSWEHFTVDANGVGRWGYWETHKLSTNLEGEKTTWIDRHWITTRTIGTLTEWNGGLAFLAGGQFYNHRSGLIGEGPIEMQMLGPLDYIGAGEAKALLSGGAMVFGGLKALRGISSFATHFPKHHIFPQAKDLRPFFTNAGINIHDHTIRVALPLHNTLHGRGGGLWVNAWRVFFRNNPGASSQEIYRHAGELMYRFGIPGGPIIRY